MIALPQAAPNPDGHPLTSPLPGQPSTDEARAATACRAGVLEGRLRRTIRLEPTLHPRQRAASHASDGRGITKSVDLQLEVWR